MSRSTARPVATHNIAHCPSSPYKNKTATPRIIVLLSFFLPPTPSCRALRHHVTRGATIARHSRRKTCHRKMRAALKC